MEIEVISDQVFKFENLTVYQKSLEFIDTIYSITVKFPKEEQFRITSQFIRAAHSIALNIADGSGGTNPEFKNFLRISKRSTRECIVCLTIALRQNYITNEDELEIRMKAVEISKMLNGLIKSIK